MRAGRDFSRRHREPAVHSRREFSEGIFCCEVVSLLEDALMRFYTGGNLPMDIAVTSTLSLSVLKETFKIDEGEKIV